MVIPIHTSSDHPLSLRDRPPLDSCTVNHRDVSGSRPDVDAIRGEGIHDSLFLRLNANL